MLNRPHSSEEIAPSHHTMRIAPRKEARLPTALFALLLPIGVAFPHAFAAEADKASIGTTAPETESDASAVGYRTEGLTPRMRAALDYAAKRYRVSQEALEPVFVIVQKTAKEFTVDPLLVLAVIAVESRFNPLSQSESGAQGLMQLIPRYHRDKLPAGAGKLPFFDPAINVRVGTMALRDFIRRGGGVVAGLQLFSGESADPGQSYSARVLAERDRLEYASHRGRAGAA